MSLSKIMKSQCGILSSHLLTFSTQTRSGQEPQDGLDTNTKSRPGCLTVSCSGTWWYTVRGVEVRLVSFTPGEEPRNSLCPRARRTKSRASAGIRTPARLSCPYCCTGSPDVALEELQTLPSWCRQGGFAIWRGS